jgi:hypothetical protein
VEVGQLHGSLFDEPTFASLASADRTLDRTKTYTIASSSYGLEQLREQIGRVESPKPGAMLRDVVAAHIKRRGFA